MSYSAGSEHYNRPTPATRRSGSRASGVCQVDYVLDRIYSLHIRGDILRLHALLLVSLLPRDQDHPAALARHRGILPPLPLVCSPLAAQAGAEDR